MKEGKLYFLRRADGLIKIGYSSDFETRLRRLTKSHGPLEIIRIINGDQKREKRLHTHFEEHNEFGEWFRDSDRLRRGIASLEDGALSAIAKTEAERAWLQGEADLVAEAHSIISRLVEARRQRTGCKHRPALDQLSEEYGIGAWLMLRIHTGRAASISAYALHVLRTILPIELMRHRDELLADIAAVEAGGLPAKLASAKGNSERAA